MDRRTIERNILQLLVLLNVYYLHKFVVDSFDFDKGPEEHCGSIGIHITF